MRRSTVLLPLILLSLSCGERPDPAPTEQAAVPELPVPVVPPTPVRPKPETPPPAPRQPGLELLEATLKPIIVGSPALPDATPRPPRAEAEFHQVLPLPTSAVPLPLTPATPPRPTPPQEQIPRDLGMHAAIDLSKLPISAGPKVKAEAAPAPSAQDLPSQVRQLPDRAPLEDPTAELSRSGIVHTILPLPPSRTPLLRTPLPDPFEYRDQLQSPLPERKLGVQPVLVNPK